MSPGSRPIHGTFPDKFPSSRNIPPRTIMPTPNPMRNFPSPPSSGIPPPPLQWQLPLPSRRHGSRIAQVGVGPRGGPPAVGAPHDETDLQEVGLHHLDQRLPLVVDGGGHRRDPHPPAVVLLDNGLEEALVQAVEAAGVHPLTGQGVVGHFAR